MSGSLQLTFLDSKTPVTVRAYDSDDIHFDVY